MQTIKDVYLKGMLAVKNHKEFGEKEKVVYNYIKLLVDEELIIIRVPDDKLSMVDELTIYSEVTLFVDIKLADANTGTSKYTANIVLSSVAPFNDKKEHKKGANS